MDVRPGDEVTMTDLRKGISTDVVVASVTGQTAIVTRAYGPGAGRQQWKVDIGFLSPRREAADDARTGNV